MRNIIVTFTIFAAMACAATPSGGTLVARAEAHNPRPAVAQPLHDADESADVTFTTTAPAAISRATK